jgi:hypothetical protein
LANADGWQLPGAGLDLELVLVKIAGLGPAGISLVIEIAGLDFFRDDENASEDGSGGKSQDKNGAAEGLADVRG